MANSTIDVNQLRERLKNQPDNMLLIDVREQGEYEAYHVPGAALFPLSDFNADRTIATLQANTADKPIYVLCQMGGRALQACELLEAAGFADTVLVAGGTQAWADAGYDLAAGNSN